jgi:hypothetical protein
MRGGNALQPIHTATTVRQRDGKRQVQDGPFSESKEQLGGYFIIEAPVRAFFSVIGISFRRSA